MTVSQSTHNSPGLGPLPAVARDRAADLHFAFVGNLQQVRVTLDAIDAEMAGRNLCPDARDNIQLVLAEVLNNVVEHAFRDRADGALSVTIEIGRDMLHCVVLDDGAPMPGLEMPNGERPEVVGIAVEDLPEGGFGWFLIHRLSESLHYERSEAGNRFTFRLPVARN